MRIGERAGLELGPPTRNAFGEALRELGESHADLVVVDADVGNSTRTEYFGDDYPERFFQVGIAESNLVGVAGGLASTGLTAVAASFAAFLTCNAYDQIRMSVGFPHLNVKLVGSHAGISIGEDGPSQMGIEDLALMTSVPGMTVLAPADGPSTRVLTRLMIEADGPFYMRTGRPKVSLVYGDGEPNLEIGRAAPLRDGDDVTLMACGLMVAASLDAAAMLADDGIEARVFDMHTVKPVDVDAVVGAAKETAGIVTAEEHLLNGGLASAVVQVAAREHPCRMRYVGLSNTYAESGKPQELLDKYGLNAKAIYSRAKDLVG